MTTFLIGTDSPETSRILAAEATAYIDKTDELYALNSVGSDADEETIATGEQALAVLAEELGAETTQRVRATTPQEDLLAAADEYGADAFVVGIRKRTPTGKVLFGSTAHDLLLETDRPVLTVPVDKTA
ncbi:universal stress protein [Halosegnis sp.]|uniref:universal stress protein n=1 Tax=Halosegnis sp. TaxID=2864959 RepID=UPI0035D523F3